MAINRKKSNIAYSPSGQPIVGLAPQPIVAQRDPATSDKAEIGTLWINPVTPAVYALTQVDGTSTWSGLGSTGGPFTDLTITGAPAQDVLTVDAGNVVITAGNLDVVNGNAAIGGTLDVVGTTTLADVVITGDFDIVDTAQITIESSAAQADAVKINASNAAGGIELDYGTGGMAVNGANGAFVVATGTGAVTLSGDVAATTVHLGTGAAAKTVVLGSTTSTSTTTINSGSGKVLINNSNNQQTSINTGTSTGAVAIGNALAGALTMDTAAGISLDAATASNFTVTGAAADLTLSSSGGSVNVTASEAASNAIRIQASDAAGGLDLDTGTGGIIADTTGAISLDSAGASNFTVTGAFDLSAISTLGSVVINGGEAAVDAVTIAATDAAGGLDINLGTGGATLDTTGAFSWDSAATSNVTVTGAGADLNLLSAGGSVLVESTEDAALAIRLHANGGTSETIQIHADQGTGAASIGLLSDVGGITIQSGLAGAASVFINAAGNAASGLDINVGTGGATLDSTGVISIDAAGVSNFTTTGAFDLTVSSTAGSTIISGGEAVIDAVQLTAGDAAGGVRVTSGALAATTGLNLVQGAVNASIQVGAGDPSHNAPKGSLYIKTDATTTTTRLWINTDGTNNWTFFTSNA